jgi:hypothetical protein
MMSTPPQPEVQASDTRTAATLRMASSMCGFRVPLLVVSAYAKPNYISGANSYPPDCTHNNYCHDFGSILNFIEYAFGQGLSPLGTIGDPKLALCGLLRPRRPLRQRREPIFPF